MVLGHVDGTARVTAREPRGDAIRFEVTLPSALARFVAIKGSIAIDGVSLTLNDVRATDGGDAEGVAVEVMIVPYTAGLTLLGQMNVGTRVNIEVDVLARYVARQLDFAGRGAKTEHSDGNPAQSHPPDQTSGPAGHDQRLLDKLRSGGWA
jgi:riboflavin synthase